MRIPGLDGLRAFSILLVLLHHAAMVPGFPEALGRRISAATPGSLGVYLFFTISGFLITNLLLEEEARHGRLNLKRFYARRFLRLMPAYFTLLVVVWLLDRQFALGVRGGEYLTALTYVRNYYYGGTWYTGHLWSLAVEEQFYFLWPLALVLARGRARWWVAIGVLLVAPVARVASYVLHWTTMRDVGFPCVADPIMAGCLLAMLTRQSGWLPQRLARPAFGRFAAIVVMLFVALSQQAGRFGIVLAPFGRTLIAIACAYLVGSYAFDRRGLTTKWLDWPAVRWLGLLSYSVYLWQQLVLVPGPAPYLAPAFAGLPLKFALVLGLATVSYYALERPLIRVRERLR